MLKRIFIMLAVALAFTIPIQAISIQELKSSPQFKVMYEVTPDGPNADEHTTWYLDTKSIEVLEYAPPMYKIKATVYNAYQSPRKTLFLVILGLCPMILVYRWQVRYIMRNKWVLR